MWLVDNFLWLVLYSVAGWTYESILCSIQERKLVNRGFLNGPLCPVYGTGSVVVLLVIGNLQGNIPALFLAGLVLTCTVEYVTAWLLETLFDTKWWDYSHMKYNIHGRICLLGAIVFGLFSVVLVQWIHPLVRGFTDGVPSLFRIQSSIVLFLLIAADTTLTVLHILKMNGRLREIQEAFDRFTDSTSDKASSLRLSIANGVRETAENLKETADEWLDNVGGLKESILDTADEWKESMKEKTGDLKETVEALSEKTGSLKSGLLEKAAQVRSALLARFEESEFFSERIRSLLDMNRLQSRRLSQAFPRMKHRRYDLAWTELKKNLMIRKQKEHK